MIGPFVDSPLASRLPFEMFDGISRVDARPINARLVKRFAEQSPRGPHKRNANRSFTEDGLRGAPPEITPAARFSVPSSIGETEPRRLRRAKTAVWSAHDDSAQRFK